MKFFWKIFFCTMFISVICFSIGGFILVRTGFTSLLKNEVQSAYDMSDVAYYALNSELEDRKNSIAFGNEDEVMQRIIRTAETIEIYQSNQKLLFSILDSDGNIIFSSLKNDFPKDYVGNLSENKRGYILREKNKNYSIQTLTPITLLGEKYYIETQNDISSIYLNQQNQYKILIAIVFGMLLVAGTITFITISLLLRRVDSLTKTTKAIASGNLQKRVKIVGDDEFTLLSNSFNQMADDLQNTIYELEQAAQNREMFVAAFSHELKTPLTSIIGYSDMLRSKAFTPERTQLCASYIFAEGKRLESLSMRLLDLIVIKNQELFLQDVYVPRLFGEIYTIVKLQLDQSDIKLNLNVESGIVRMEPDLMMTVFLNLLDNARKAMDSGGDIYVQGKSQNGFYTVKIIDNGKGMLPEELVKIKEAFYMVDKSRARKQGGAGLGLAICDEVLKLHGFEIKFESKIDIGTTVTIIMKDEKYD